MGQYPRKGMGMNDKWIDKVIDNGAKALLTDVKT